jgi:hypothetical protein
MNFWDRYTYIHTYIHTYMCGCGCLGECALEEGEITGLITNMRMAKQDAHMSFLLHSFIHSFIVDGPSTHLHPNPHPSRPSTAAAPVAGGLSTGAAPDSVHGRHEDAGGRARAGGQGE